MRSPDGVGRGETGVSGLAKAGGAVLALSMLLVAFGTFTAPDRPEERVEVRATLTGASAYENLSAAERRAVREMVTGADNTTVVSRSGYRENFTTLPALDSTDAYYIEYRDDFYRLKRTAIELNRSGNRTDAYRLELAERTDRVRLEYRALDAETRDVLDDARAADGPITVDSVPAPLTGGVRSSSIGGPGSRTYVAWDGEYYTVATFEPAEYTRFSTGVILTLFGYLGAALGLALVLASGVVTLVRRVR